MQKLAKEIYDLHLRPGAPEAVNTNSQVRQTVKNQLQNPPSHLFAQAEKEVSSSLSVMEIHKKIIHVSDNGIILQPKQYAKMSPKG